MKQDVRRTVSSTFTRLFMGLTLLLVTACIPNAPKNVAESVAENVVKLESFTVQTDDGETIAATLKHPDINDGDKVPAVIFIHQGGSSKDEWINTSLFETVVATGFVALAYDVRGHGQSSGQGGAHLFDDPDLAPRDLKAALIYLRTLPYVDPERIAIVGSSIGANLACVALGQDIYGVSRAVAISGKTSAVYNLAGGRDQLTTLSGLYAIASENEQGGKRAQWARDLYQEAPNQNKLEITANSNRHGTSIFKDDPTLEGRILDWLKGEL